MESVPKMKSKIVSIPIGLIILVFLAGCSLPGSSASPTQDPGPSYTQAAETIIAGLTQIAPPATATLYFPVQTEPPTPTLSPPTRVPDTPTPTATIAPTSTESPDKVIFTDNFEGRESWYTADNDRFSLSYENDGYVIWVDIANAPVWSVRNQDYEDVILEVDAARLEGPENGTYGLICRQEADDNFYLFLISSSGNFGIGKVENGEFEFIEEGSDTAGVIHGGDVLNHLRAECIGDTLALSVNGQRLVETKDDDFISGDIGLVVKTGNQKGLEVYFDNFTVLEAD